MKNIKNFRPDKYLSSEYYEIEPDIFRVNNNYVTSICFQQEPELGEINSLSKISQYPLEDILDHFNVYISDFYNELNEKDKSNVYCEFSSNRLENIRFLRTIIGKHVFNRLINSCTEESFELVIEG